MSVHCRNWNLEEEGRSLGPRANYTYVPKVENGKKIKEEHTLPVSDLSSHNVLG
jgi:hypothetical protein